jgi:hypothetical protein
MSDLLITTEADGSQWVPLEKYRELEAALAGQHETVCAYCWQVFKREDHDAVLAHIKTCENRPEKAIIETGRRVEKVYMRRIAALFDAGMKVVECHEQKKGVSWGDTGVPLFIVRENFERDEAVNELRNLLMKGPDDASILEEPEA